MNCMRPLNVLRVILTMLTPMSVNQIWPTISFAMINATFLNMILIQEHVVCFQHCKNSALTVSAMMIVLFMWAKRPYHYLLYIWLQVQSKQQLQCQVMLKVMIFLLSKPLLRNIFCYRMFEWKSNACWCTKHQWRLYRYLEWWCILWWYLQ